MKRTLLAGAAVLALTAVNPALGADIPVRMPVKAPPPAVATLYNWTGCYIGAHAGYAWGNKVVDNVGLLQANVHVNNDGGFVGGQVGCNLQRDRFVVGFEGQAAWANISGQLGYNPNISYTPTGFRTTTDILGSIAARFAYAFGTTGESLLFVKIGAAFAHEQYFLSGPFFANLNLNSQEVLRWGLMLGIGWEQALSRNVSVKFEYDFNNFGRKDFQFCNNGAFCLNDGIKSTTQLVKVGINYRFGDNPVVARY